MSPERPNDRRESLPLRRHPEGGDPLEFAVQQAHALRTRWRLPVPFLNEAFAILRGALGETWLRTQLGRRSPGSPFPRWRHPIGALLGIAGPEQIIELLELARYLGALAHHPGLDIAIGVLKSSYETALLQLALAYRFTRLGVADLDLEPISQGGRADIGFTHYGARTLVECYVPEDPSSVSFELSIFKGPNLAKLLGRQPVCVSVRFVGPATKAVRASVVRRLTESLERPSPVPAHVLADDFEIAVEPLAHGDAPLPPEADRLHRALGQPRYKSELKLVPGRDLQAYVDGSKDVAARSVVYVWPAPGPPEPKTPEAAVEALLSRIGDKLPQTRDGSQVRSLVAVGLSHRGARRLVSVASVSELAARLAMKHRRVGTVLLLTRVWLPDERFGLDSAVLPDSEPWRVHPELIAQLRAFDRARDVMRDGG